MKNYIIFSLIIDVTTPPIGCFFRILVKINILTAVEYILIRLYYNKIINFELIEHQNKYHDLENIYISKLYR